MNEKYNVCVLGMVAIVAIIGMVVLVTNSGRAAYDDTSYLSTEDAQVSDLSGAAIAVIGSDGWTQWFNRDSPGGNGDYETLRDIRATYTNVCANPTGIQCQTAAGADYITTRQNVTCNVVEGLYCLNSRNGGSSSKVVCKDYRVRFKCPITNATSCTGSSSQNCTVAYGMGVQNRTCNNGAWSAWSSCKATSCNAGYFLNGTRCDKIPTHPTIPANMTINLARGDKTIYAGKTVSLLGFSQDSATVNVSGSYAVLKEGDLKTVNGLRVSLDALYIWTNFSYGSDYMRYDYLKLNVTNQTSGASVIAEFNRINETKIVLGRNIKYVGHGDDLTKAVIVVGTTTSTISYSVKTVSGLQVSILDQKFNETGTQNVRYDGIATLTLSQS